MPVVILQAISVDRRALAARLYRTFNVRWTLPCCYFIFYTTYAGYLHALAGRRTDTCLCVVLLWVV